jgi:hypothetical protein
MARRSERAGLVGYFTDEINKERKGTKWGKVSYAYIATTLAKTCPILTDLYASKRQLEDYRARGNSFSKGFFGALKPRESDV